MTDISNKLVRLVLKKENYLSIIQQTTQMIAAQLAQQAMTEPDAVQEDEEKVKELFGMMVTRTMAKHEEQYPVALNMTQMIMEEAYSDEELEKLLSIYEENPWMIDKSTLFANMLSGRMLAFGQRIGQQVAEEMQANGDFERIMGDGFDFEFPDREEWE